MSSPYPDVSEVLYEEYLSWCRANDVRPKIDDYFIWLEDNDYDADEVLE